MPSRRHLLAAAGLAAASPGCLRVLGDDGSESTNDAPADTTGDATGDAASEGIRIGKLSVRNNHGEAHQVQLAVESGEGIMHMDTYEFDADGGTVVEGEWTSTAAEYLVHARLDDGEIQSTDVAGSVDDETTCVQMVLRIDAEGSLGVLYGPNCDR